MQKIPKQSNDTQSIRNPNSPLPISRVTLPSMTEARKIRLTNYASCAG